MRPPAAGSHLALPERLYEAVVRVAPTAARLASPFSSKLDRGIRARRDVVERLTRWAAESRDPERPLVWTHAPSLGEGLMAQAILSALRSQRPDAQVLFTHFSPSAERLRGQIDADAFEYLPWDARAWLSPAMDALRPSVVAFVRTDVWPVLSAEARRVGAALVLANAVLGPASSRVGPAGRVLLGPAYRRLSAVGAVSEEDGARFRLLGVPASAIRVTGDARFDQVRNRLRGLDREAPLLRRVGDPQRPALVAGSTWPEDEERLISGLGGLVREGRLRLVIAPHEPTAGHLRGLEGRLAAAGVIGARLGEVEAGSAPLPAAVIVDRVGVLADLYAAAAVAYVGGGFGRSGLHSVVEPAGLGLPVVFGPRVGSAREAEVLERERGGFRVGDAAALEAVVRSLMESAAARQTAGAAAERFVLDRLGGARANAALIVSLIQEAGA